MTSAAERACALVGNMLAAGPRNAAEILTAAEGANNSGRTIQRAATALGVVKTKAGFNGGWTWRLPADDVGSRNMLEARGKDASSIGSIFKDTKGPATVEPSRAKVIAARLRRLEEIRGKKAPIHASDPRVLRWAQSGIGDPELREAYECAVYDLESTKSPAPVTAGLLDRFVMQAIANTGEF